MAILSEERSFRVTKEKLIAVRLPQQYWTVKLGYWGENAVQEERRRYVGAVSSFVRQGEGLIVHGYPRTGKTSFCSILLRKVLTLGGSCLFVSWDEVLSGRLIDEVKSRMFEVDFLVLDGFHFDYFVRKGEVDPELQLRELVKFRQSWLRSTILETCLTKKQLSQGFSRQYTIALMQSVFSQSLAFDDLMEGM